MKAGKLALVTEENVDQVTSWDDQVQEENGG